MSMSHPLIKVLSSVASLTHLVRVVGDGFFVKDSQCFEEGATSMTVLVFVSLHSGTSVRLSGDYNPISVCLDVNYWLSNGSGYLVHRSDRSEWHVQAAEILQAANTVFSTSSTRPTKAQDRRLAHPSSSSFAQMPDQDAP